MTSLPTITASRYPGCAGAIFALRRRWTCAVASILLAGCMTTTGPGAQGPLPSQVPAEIAGKLKAIGPVVNPPATAALYAPLQRREPYTGVEVQRDVAYGPGPRHLLDLFRPTATGAGPRPVLVFVHGGAFTRGDRRSPPGSPFYDNVMLWAASAGMVGVNVTYRLAPQTGWPGAQEDLAAALRWVRQHAGAHGADPARVYLMGHSAGAAHVAQYLGHPRFWVAPNAGLAGAILLSGLFDMTTAEPNEPLRAYFGADAGRYAAMSALPGLVQAPVPLMIGFAEFDPVDFRRQAAQARDALCRAGQCPTFVELLGHGHMSEIYAINSQDRALTDAIDRFIQRHQTTSGDTR